MPSFALDLPNPGNRSALLNAWATRLMSHHIPWVRTSMQQSDQIPATECEHSSKSCERAAIDCRNERDHDPTPA